MSWPGEDWTATLTGHVLQKVKQLQDQNEKLNKERQQRQLQLDNSEVALHKQKQKYEEVRLELAAVHRELGGVREAAQAEVRTRERLSHDLQVKTGQVHSLEGQLESAKNLTQNLTQEIKRLEAELEKLQKGNGSGDSMLFSTPCWNMSSPRDYTGGFKADVDGKTQHVRQQLQFGDVPKPAMSSPFPQRSPPLRRHVRQSEATTPSSMFPWERDDLRSTPKGRPAPSVSSGDVIKSSDSGIEDALRNEIDGLRVRVSDLQREALLESERLKDVESRLAQSQRDITAKEQNLTRIQDQLTRAQTRITQETDRVQAGEQKVKQLQEELKCQRQNAETSRCNAEQRRKDMEREHQRELLEQQRERQALEKQHQQEINKLNQEIQQARILHNTLQAQHDKVCLQKQGLERDLEDVKGKLKNTETELRESQKRETQTETKLTEALRENENLTVSLGQLKKQEKALQEEVKRLTDELAEALKLIKELQAQLAAPPQPVSVPYLSPSVSIHRDRSPPYHQKKRSPQTVRTRDEERMKYPSGREPGEGIDSEQIGNFGSEESPRFSGLLKRSDTDVDISLTEQDTGIEDVDTDSLASDSIGTISDIRDIKRNTEKRDTPSIKTLTKENSELRDELQDVKYELQKRLEDLESQRKAETEARTKLKQLSRKHSTQTEQQRAKALELKDNVAKLEAQLEQEKKESAKLRETLDVLEKETEKDQSAELKDTIAEMEQKETLMEEEMNRMRKELDEAQLELEREREEQLKQIQKEKVEGLKIAQLQEELDNLKKCGANENLPVTYLQLENHPNDAVPPESIVCDSVNLHNTMISNETKATELIMDLGAQTKPQGTTSEGKTIDEQETLDNTTVLVLEIERLRAARDRESDVAKQAQRKLEDLQKQVTAQTKQLTVAFESQSKHIDNLLRELQEKECALRRLEEKISLLEETQHIRKGLTDLKPLTEVSRELSRDSVISNTSDQEMFNDDTLRMSKNELILEESVSETANKLQIVSEVPVSEGSDALTKNNETENSNVQRLIPEPFTDVDDRDVKMMAKELRETQIQLNVLKAQNETLGLDGNKAREEMMSVKRENEELKSKLRQPERDGTFKGDLLDVNEGGLSDSASSGQEESVVLNENAKDEEIKRMRRKQESTRCRDERNTTTEVHSLQEQIQALQNQIQNLSEQNRNQAEELELWKISAMEETENKGSPSITLKEFEMFLPCTCTNLTGTVRSKCSADMSHQCGLEGRDDQIDLLETKLIHTEELMTGNAKQMNIECKSRSLNHNDKTVPDLMTSNTKDKRSDLQQVVLLSPEHQINTTDDASVTVSISSQNQTKVINSKTTTKLHQNAHSQNFDLCTTDEKKSPSVLENEVSNTMDVKEVNSVSTQTDEIKKVRGENLFPTKLHVSTQTDNEDDVDKEPSESPPLSPAPQSVTNQLLLSKAFPMTDPAHLAERIRQNRNRMSAAYDDTEYEPYGLPEVVMKGFADIPSGPACPYVLRRGLLGTESMPLPLRQATPPEENEDLEL